MIELTPFNNIYVLQPVAYKHSFYCYNYYNWLNRQLHTKQPAETATLINKLIFQKQSLDKLKKSAKFAIIDELERQAKAKYWMKRDDNEFTRGN